MPYTKIQCIAYEADTMLGEDERGKPRYIGSSRADEDIKKRCAIMKDAIHNAYRLDGIDTHPQTLKVFMAPEFYFRSAEGAYPVEKISKIMETMRQKTDDLKYSHWLFVLGTAIGRLDISDSAEIFNIALVQKGGPAVVGHTLREALVYKEYISHVDFIREHPNADWRKSRNRKAVVGGRERKLLPTQGSRDVRAWYRGKNTSEQNTSGLGGGSIFTIDGITFGLEICLDHATQRLKQYQPASGEKLPQIQLIPSGGMNIMAPSVLVRQGMVIFNVDGVAAAAGSALNPDHGYLMDQWRLSSVVKIDVPPQWHEPAELSNVQNALVGWNWLLTTHSKYFRGYGNLRAYESVAIPPARTQP